MPTGEAFGPGPARGTLPGQMQVVGFQGRGLVNSFYRGVPMPFQPQKDER